MKRILTLACVSVLAACSSQVTLDTILAEKKLDRDMYLRGDFNLMDAEPQYKFNQVAPTIYQAKVTFSTPGKVYEFKIADSEFSSGYNCGYSEQESTGELKLGQKKAANCDVIYNNFSFIPAIKGSYIVSIDFSDYDKPQVTITKG